MAPTSNPPRVVQTYERNSREGALSILHYFTDSSNPPHRIWKGRLRDGYPSISLSKKETATVIRLIYSNLIGEIPDGEWVVAKCRQYLCVSPECLVVTKRGHWKARRRRRLAL